MKKIKVYGERNSGTNFLMSLIHKNMKANMLRGTVPNRALVTYNEFTKDLFFKLTDRNNLGWKHSFADPNKVTERHIKKGLIIITITKNPYSFLLSLYRRPYHLKGNKPETFREFLENPWELTQRDGLKRKRVGTPIELWNMKNRSYMEIAKKFKEGSINLKYEDLLNDPLETIRSLGKKHDIPLDQELSNTNQSTKKDDKDFSDYQKYYLEEKWKEELSDEHLAIMNKNLDQEVMTYFGYPSIESVDS